MSVYPHRTDPEQEQGAADPAVPRSLPQHERRKSRAALGIMLLALVIFALVILL